MYLHIGQDTVVQDRDIIGIFDMDNTTVSKDTVQFLSAAEKNGEIRNVSPLELPKSFLICEAKRQKTIYLSPVSVGTVLKRAEMK